MNTRQIGKRTEDRVAEILEGERVSAPWRAGPDVVGKAFIAECKARKTLPEWIEHALHQAERVAAPDQLPIAVLHQKGRRHHNDLVVVRMDKFREWFASNGELSDAELSE